MNRDRSSDGSSFLTLTTTAHESTKRRRRFRRRGESFFEPSDARFGEHDARIDHDIARKLVSRVHVAREGLFDDEILLEAALLREPVKLVSHRRANGGVDLHRGFGGGRHDHYQPSFS